MLLLFFLHLLMAVNSFDVNFKRVYVFDSFNSETDRIMLTIDKMKVFLNATISLVQLKR